MSSIDLSSISSSISSLAAYDGETPQGLRDCLKLIDTQMFSKGHVAYMIASGTTPNLATSRSGRHAKQ